MKILVVRLDHLGDLLLTTPLIRALSLGGHSVDVLARASLRPVFENSRFVEHCFGLEEVAPRFPSRWWELSRWMRAKKYQVVILAYAKEPRLCLASALSGAKRRIAMWSGVWGRLTGHACLPSHIFDNPRPVSEILLSCSRALGATDQGLKPDLFFSANEVESTRELIPKSLRERRLIGIHPGSAGNACNLPSHVYAAIAAQILRETDYGIVLTGTTDELKLLTDWPAKILSSERVWNALGQISLRELGCIVAEMTVYVCSSTGPLHVASAVGTRTVSPFCPALPMNAAIWGNVGAKSRVVEPEACPRLSGSESPCDFRGTISASDIFAAVIDLASSAKPL